MLSHGLTVYFRISPSICFSYDFRWGQSIHFVHSSKSTGEGIPLNKEYGFSLMVLWFYLDITYNVPLEYKDEESND